MRIMLALAAGLIAMPAAAQSPPAEEGDAIAGRDVARTWCVSCHVVEPHPDRAVAGSVPSFMAIADRAGTTKDGLRAFLATQHGRMPNLSLSNTDIENLVAYLLSLKGR